MTETYDQCEGCEKFFLWDTINTFRFKKRFFLKNKEFELCELCTKQRIKSQLPKTRGYCGICKKAMISGTAFSLYSDKEGYAKTACPPCAEKRL